MAEKLPATTLVILGVSGDLSRRYLLPALAEICRSSEISASLKILGISRRELKPEEIITDKLKDLSEQFSLLQVDYEQAGDYQKLKDRLNQLEAERVIFYFAVPPQAVLPIVQHLGSNGLNGEKYRLLMEKPFGTDLASAKELISQIGRHFKEEQVYRIDHYLAKGMAQNVAVFLGSNALFKEVWNNKFIDRIEIVAEESLGVEGREGFYENTGALRDFVQSHMLQLAALSLMETPDNIFDFSQLPARRLAVLNKLSAEPDTAVKGQYEGYRQLVGNPDSRVETFAALVLHSSDPKWQGVPIYLATGKKMARKLTEIRIFFKRTLETQTNLLRLRLHPQEGIDFELWIKKPGYDNDLQMLPLEFNYDKHFKHLPDAYEQVIVDAVRSRTNLFASSGEVLASWEILEPILKIWDSLGLKSYKAGSHIVEIDPRNA
jgi:glucose-6-phosphate 1-dehydrogenase